MWTIRMRVANITMAITLVLGTACAQRGGGSAALARPTRPTGTFSEITESDLRQRLGVIAHDSMEGRFTGSDGHRKTTDYLAAEMRRLGLRPAGEDGSYFQRVPFLVRRVALEHRLSVNGTALAPMRDFVAIHPGGQIRSFDGVEAIYGGFLEDTTHRITPEQARGRFVILIYRNTRNTAGNIRTAQFDPRLRDAAVIATVNPDVAMASWARLAVRPQALHVATDDPTRPTPSAMAISARAAAQILGRTADSTLMPGTVGRIVHGTTPFRTDTLAARNVVAVLPGSDPVLSAEYVALGAHSDHVPYSDRVFDHDSIRAFQKLAEARRRELGVSFLTFAQHSAIRVNVDSLRAIRPARADTIHNGADDDGSGTVALLEIAEALAGAKARPRRSVLFVWHAAEELGLLGARHFTDHPTVPRQAIVTQLNLDMVGRGGTGDQVRGGPDYLEIIGWRRLSTELGDQIADVNVRSGTPFKFELRFDAPGHPEQRYCRSDHFAYARYGIPIAFLSTGDHADYHMVTDEVQYIDFAKLRRVTTFARDIVLTLADRDRRPSVDGPVQDSQAPCVQ